MKLINSQEKPFNKKVNEQEFFEALNIPGMHEKRYKGNAYDKLRRSQKSKCSQDSNISVDVQSEGKNLDKMQSNPQLKSTESIAHVGERLATDQMDDVIQNDEGFDQMSTSQKIEHLKGKNVTS